MATRRQVSIFINGQEVAGSIKVIQKEMYALRKITREATVGSEEYADAVKKYRNLDGILKEHRKNLGGIEQGYKSILSSGIGKLGGLAAGAFAVDKIVGYGKELFRTGVQMDALNRKAATVFGDTLPQITEEAKKNAAAMGLTTAQYVAQAASIQDLLIPMGFQRKEASAITINLTNLSGALSEWTGGQKTSEEVAQTLSKALLGEREELKGLGISILDADVKARLAQKGLAGLTGQALEQAKAMATLELITEKSTDAQKAYAENSDTLIRQQAELTSKFQNIKESLSIALIPAFNRLLDVAGGFVDVVEDISGANQKASESVSELQAQFNIEIETLKRGNLTQENRNKLIDEINKKYSSYLPNLITEKDSYEDLTAAQDAANKKFVERITLLAAEEKFQDVQSRRLDAVTRQLELEKKLSEAEADRANNRQVTGIGGINTSEGQVKGVTELIRQNQKAQEDLRKEFDETAAAAAKLGVDITKALTGGSTPTAGGGGGGGGGDNKAAERARKEREKEAERRRKELEKQAEDELEFRQKLAEDQAIKELAEESKRQEEELTRLEDYEQEKFDAQQSFKEYANEYLLTEYEKQLLEAETQYQNLLALAEKYNLNTQDIESAHQARLAQIKKEAADKELESEKKRKELITKGEQDLADARLGVYQQLVGGLNEVFGDLEEAQIALFLINKALAAAEVIVNLQKELAVINATYAALPPVAAALSTKAIVRSSLSLATIGATTVLGFAKKTNRTKQKKEGGFTQVIGEDDGRTYNAQYIGTPGTGMLPGRPVVLASEAGPEYFVSNQDLRKPRVFNYVRAIENLKGRAVPQFAEGGFNTTGIPSGGSSASTTPTGGLDNSLMMAIFQTLQRINDRLDNPVPATAIIPDETLVGSERRLNKLNAASGGVLR